MQQNLPVQQEQQLERFQPSKHRPVPPPQAQLQHWIPRSMKKPLLSKQLPQEKQLRLQLAALT